MKDYTAAHPGVLLDAAGNVKDTGVLSVIPTGDVLRGVFDKDSYGLDQLKGFTVLHEEVGLNGTEIKGAQVSRDPITGQPTVIFNLTPPGGETFYKLTSANVGKLLAVALDDKVKAQATIEEPIRDQVSVAGSSWTRRMTSPSRCEPARCPCRWRSPASRPIGASLGQDAINQGIKASRHRRRSGHALHALLLPQGRAERRDPGSSLTSISSLPSCRCSASR